MTAASSIWVGFRASPEKGTRIWFERRETHASVVCGNLPPAHTFVIATEQFMCVVELKLTPVPARKRRSSLWFCLLAAQVGKSFLRCLPLSFFLVSIWNHMLLFLFFMPILSNLSDTNHRERHRFLSIFRLTLLSSVASINLHQFVCGHDHLLRSDVPLFRQLSGTLSNVVHLSLFLYIHLLSNK